MYVLNCDRMLSRQPLHSRKWSRAQSLPRYWSWFFSSVTTWMLAVAMNRRLHLSSTSSQRLDTCHNSMSLLPVFFGCWYSVVWLKWCVGLDERSYSSSIEINIEMGYHFIWINSSAGTLQLYFFSKWKALSKWQTAKMLHLTSGPVSSWIHYRGVWLSAVQHLHT